MEPGNSENLIPANPIEPSTTVSNEEGFFRILTSLPEIDEEKIRIELENNPAQVTIIASDSSVQFKKVIPIPCEVRISKKRFADGVLELILDKISG